MKFVGDRALLGAAAMIMVGIVLSMMSTHYIAGDSEAEALTTSRWWWEIVLNSQILCAAFVWFTHIDRYKSASGWKALVSLLQFLSGFVAVLLPLWIAIAAILLGWFETRPEIGEIHKALVFCLAVWAGSWVLIWVVECVGRKRLVLPWFARSKHLPLMVLGIAPLLSAILLTLVETWRGGTMHYMYVPFLFYLQGAMPYLARSFRPSDPVDQQASRAS